MHFDVFLNEVLEWVMIFIRRFNQYAYSDLISEFRHFWQGPACTCAWIIPYCGCAITSIDLLTRWGRMTHISVSKLAIIGSDNGMSPGRRQAIISTNDGILLTWRLGTQFSETLNEFHFIYFNSRKCPWECRLQNGGHFVSTTNC